MYPSSSHELNVSKHAVSSHSHQSTYICFHLGVISVTIASPVSFYLSLANSPSEEVMRKSSIHFSWGTTCFYLFWGGGLLCGLPQCDWCICWLSISHWCSSFSISSSCHQARRCIQWAPMPLLFVVAAALPIGRLPRHLLLFVLGTQPSQWHLWFWDAYSEPTVLLGTSLEPVRARGPFWKSSKVLSQRNILKSIS